MPGEAVIAPVASTVAEAATSAVAPVVAETTASAIAPAVEAATTSLEVGAEAVGAGEVTGLTADLTSKLDSAPLEGINTVAGVEIPDAPVVGAPPAPSEAQAPVFNVGVDGIPTLVESSLVENSTPSETTAATPPAPASETAQEIPDADKEPNWEDGVLRKGFADEEKARDIELSKKSFDDPNSLTDDEWKELTSYDIRRGDNAITELIARVDNGQNISGNSQEGLKALEEQRAKIASGEFTQEMITADLKNDAIKDWESRGRKAPPARPSNTAETSDSVAPDGADKGETPVDQATEQDNRVTELEARVADGTITDAEKEELDRIKASKSEAEDPKTEAEKLADAEQKIKNLETKLDEMSKSLKNMEAVVKGFSELLPEMQKLIQLQIKNEQDPEKKKEQEALLIKIIKAIAAGVLAGFIDITGDIKPQQQGQT